MQNLPDEETTIPPSWGLGLRPAHFSDFHQLKTIPPLEVMADNLLHHHGGPALSHTRAIAARAPFILLHGIGLNIGGVDPLDDFYLAGLKRLEMQFQPRVISDHLCFTQAEGIHTYELLPIIRDQNHLEHIIKRIDQVQQRLGRQFCLENVSAYIAYRDDSIPEGDFLNNLALKTGCGILLDVNNVFVSATNLGLDPSAELARYDLNHVQQIHVSGHSERQNFLFDTHDKPVCDAVWDLLKPIVLSHPQIPMVLENDSSDVSLSDLLVQLKEGAQRCFHE